jgi:autotransporter family porin
MFKYMCVVLMVLIIQFPTAAQEITITTCDFASLQTALDTESDVNIVLDCSGTIVFEEEITILGDKRIVGGEGVVFDGDNQTRFFWVESGERFFLEAVTLQNGQAEQGGAILNQGITSIINVVFMNNTGRMGGAIYNERELLVQDSKFNNNIATAEEDDEPAVGGAILNQLPALLAVINTTFVENEAEYGGAIFNFSELTIGDSTFVGNTAQWTGAGIHNAVFGNATVLNSVFSDHNADYGTVIMNDNANLTIMDSIFSGNTAQAFGGVLYNINNGTISILYSQFINNSASFAGVIHNEVGELTVETSLFYQNSSFNQAGAIYNLDTATITNSTFLENSAADRGGALYAFGSGTQMTIIHSTFVNNTDTGGAGTLYVYGMATLIANLITGDSGQCSGMSEIVADDTNISTQACGDARVVDDLMLGEFDGVIIPLLPDSPALDALDAPCAAEVDQLGTPRPQGDKCDIGAVEMDF